MPKLDSTNVVDKGRRHITKSGKSLPEWYNLPPGPERERIRSKTFPGIAKAMAQQWGDFITNQNTVEQWTETTSERSNGSQIDIPYLFNTS